MNNKFIFKALKRFEVFYKDKKFDFNLLEEELISNISIDKNESRIYVLPKDNDYLIIVNLIYGLLKYSFDGIYKDGEDILDSINVGDLVEYNRALAKFDGIVDERIILKFRDGIIRIPLNSRYKLSRYNGSATILNKMPTKSNVGTKKTKSLLSQILDIEEDELCKINKKSILFVANKDRIFKIIKGLKLKIGSSELVDISEVFPIAYYTSVDNCYYFKGNSKKEEPLIKFTSKVYIARELVKKIRGISSVSILSNKVYIDDFSDLKYIKKRKNIMNTIMFISPVNLERFVNNNYINDEFKISEVEFSSKDFSTVSELKQRQYSYFSNYLGREVNYLDIKEDIISVFRRNMNNECKRLLELFKDDNEIFKFIILVRRLCNRLVMLSIPINAYESKIVNINRDESLKFMRGNILEYMDFIKSKNLHKDIINSIDLIWNCIDGIYMEVNKCNEKWNRLDELIKYNRNERISIIVENVFLRGITRIFIKERYPYKHNISIDDGKNYSELYDQIIILGRMNENLYSNYNRYNSSNVYILGYKFEKRYFNICRKKFLKYVRANLEESESKDDLYINTDDKLIEEVGKDNFVDEYELENEINSLITINHMPGINQVQACNSSVKCEKIISFIDSRKAFLTSQYKACVLKESTEELQIKSVKQLNIGDILLFVEGIEKDVVEKVVQGLMQLKEIRDVYSKDYELSKAWKKELKQYMEINDLNYNDLRERLSRLNIKRDKATIRNWVIDGIVGPQEEEVFDAIAKLTNSEFLKNKTTEVYNACNNVRSFQIKVRKLIAKFILNGTKIEDLEQIDRLIISNIDNEINYINKVQIDKIYDIVKEVPSYLANRVLEE